MNKGIFDHLASESVRANYMRLKGKIGTDYVLAEDYSYIECQLAKRHTTSLKPGDFTVLLPAVSVDPAKKCKLLVVPHQLLSVIGTVSHQLILEPGDGEKIGFSLKVEKAFDLKTLPYLCRIYMIYN